VIQYFHKIVLPCNIRPLRIELAESISDYCDMGACNQDLWKHVRVASTQTSLQNSLIHPCVKPKAQLYLMVDVLQNLKSIQNR